jgi:hypothetical protein
MVYFIDSDFKLNLNKQKFSKTCDLFHVYYYVIISSTKFMVIAINHMAMECLLESHLNSLMD